MTIDVEYELRFLHSDGITCRSRFFAYASGAFGEALREMKAGRIMGWCIRENPYNRDDTENYCEGPVIAMSENWMKLI